MNWKAAGIPLAAAVLCACGGGSGAVDAVPAVTAAGAHAVGASTDVVAGTPSFSLWATRDLGRAARNTPMSLAVVLKYRNERELARFVEEQYATGAHHWLTNDEFDARFAPSQNTYDRVVRSLTDAGFTVTQRFDNRTVVDVTGTVARVERYFGTEIHRLSVSGYGSGLVNVREAHAPAALGGAILSVAGLDTVAVMHPFVERATGSVAQRRPQGADAKLFGPVSSVTGLYGYGPLAFSGAYNLPIRHGYDGKGRGAAVVVDGDYANSDLATYLKYFGIKRTGPATRRVRIDGGPPAGLTSIESILDVSTIVANAPGTRLSVYELKILDAKDITDAYNRVVADNTADAVNSSFGAPECLFPTTTEKAWNAIAQQGLAKGMVFAAATGDSGASECPNSPANLPNFVAVGGTALNVGKNGTWASETGWSGSGGGVSAIFAQPAWQQHVENAIDRGRNSPDVAFDGATTTGAALYMSGSWNTGANPVAGTSLAAPLFVAAVTDIDDVKGTRAGLSAAKLYSSFAAHGYGSKTTLYFHDITLGNNGLFYALPGYDLVGGIGSIDAWNLAKVL